MLLEAEKRRVEDELEAERTIVREKDALLDRTTKREAEEDIAALQADIDVLQELTDLRWTSLESQNKLRLDLERSNREHICNGKESFVTSGDKRIRFRDKRNLKRTVKSCLKFTGE